MPANTALARPSTPRPSWSRALDERDIALAPVRNPIDGFSLEMSGRWFVLREHSKDVMRADRLADFDSPGFWKPVQNTAASACRVFEIPSWTVPDSADGDPSEDAEEPTLGQMLDWALATRDGDVPRDWQPPARELAESWLPNGALTVQADGQVRQGKMILRPDCWALQMPLLPRLPHDLPALRLQALRELVWDAQSHWTLVRFAKVNDGQQTSLLATVDFTGAPHSELLFSAGLDALRHVTGAIVETVDVLATSSVALECLSLDCPTKPATKRKIP